MCCTVYSNAIIVFIIETLSLETFRLHWHNFSSIFAEEKRISCDWIANSLVVLNVIVELVNFGCAFPKRQRSNSKQKKKLEKNINNHPGELKSNNLVKKGPNAFWRAMFSSRCCEGDSDYITKAGCFIENDQSYYVEKENG